ncbi:MAG: metalloregulator ArsR/SmtB family transcription factor [Dehalococcoidales bacterium]|nr:metalloregulator ArsR/SmtB family transcription factor [Dehalococcoidales bacterium]
MEDQIYQYHAEMCQVFSHPKRLEAIDVLRDGEMTVTELAQKLELTIGNLSQHLSMMKERHILLTRKEGNMVYYRIANPKLIRCFDMMREMLFEQIRQDAALLEVKAK